jgi:hypothetical protein
MGKVTENGYIVMTEVLTTVQDLHRKLSTGKGGAEWHTAMGRIHTCKIVCGHSGLKAVSSAMDRAEAILGRQYCEQDLTAVLAALDDVIVELRPRVHGAPTIPSGNSGRPALR